MRRRDIDGATYRHTQVAAVRVKARDATDPRDVAVSRVRLLALAAVASLAAGWQRIGGTDYYARLLGR